MASADTLCKKLLNVKNVVVESHNFYNDSNGVTHLRSMPVLMPGIRMTAPSAEEGIFPDTTVRPDATRSGAVWTLRVFSLKSKLPPTVSPSRNTELSPPLFRGHTLRKWLDYKEKWHF